MAILKNLLVSGGASRFLGTTYFQDVSIGGTASLASLSLSGNLSVGGTLGVTGEATFSNVAVFSKVGQSTATWNNPALVVGGTADQKHLELCNDTIQGKNNKNTTNNLYLNYYGSTVYLAGSKIYAMRDSTFVAPTANMVTVNAQNVNVTNNLRANHFDLQTVAQLGGSFYVSPTVKFPNSGTTLKVEKSDSTLTLTITDSSITSTTMAGVVWAANSRVKVSGTINGVVTGTMDGTVSSINTSSHFITLSVSGENSGNVQASPSGNPYTASQFSDLTVMIYQRRDGSNDYRVGIWMNCYDVANSSSTIRIYGGSDANPNVMLGNLTSAGLGTVNNLTPTGWGLFAQNAFLHGKVVANGGLIGNWTIGESSMYYSSDTPSDSSIVLAPGGKTASVNIGGSGTAQKSWVFTVKNLFGVDTSGALYSSSGKIGGWNIGTSSLYNTTNSMTSTGVGLYLGTDGIRNYASGTQYVNITSGKITALGVDVSGKITANTGYIGGTSGWTIASQQLSNGTLGADNSLYLGTKNLGSNTSIAERPGSDWRLTVGSNFGVTNTGAIYATAGKIGGWTININSIYAGTWGTNGGALVCTGSGTSKSIGGSASISGWVFTAGANFGVTTAGALYADSAHITGEVTATSGTIGGVTANSSYGLYTNSKTSATSTNTGFLISKDGAIYLGAYNSTNKACPFQVTSAGVLTATGATINGTLTAGANSKIGPWTVSKTSIYKGSNSINSTSSTEAYFGNDGLSIGGLLKIDARSGADTTISLGNTSSSNIAISSNGLMINNNTTSMATFNTEGIEMRGTDEQLLLDINTTGKPITQSDSIVFSIQPIEVDSTYEFELNEDKNENLRNVVGNVNVIVTFINGQEPSVLDTFTFNLNSDYNKNMGSGFTFNYKSKVSTFDDPYFSITCSGVVYGSECELVIDISWNYTQYPYNYTFGTRSKYGVRGIGSAIIGKNLENTNDNALVIGQYNKNGNYLFAVGNGDSDSNRSNAFTVDNYGVVGFSGVAMFGDPGSTFYVGSYVVVNNASVASLNYKEGTRTIELAGYYPLCVAGYNSNTRYLTPVKFYLSDQQSGSGQLHYMIFNPTSSARTGTCTMWVMWVKTT